MRKRYLMIGMGVRGLMFAKGFLGWPDKGRSEFVERAQIVGLMDTNMARCKACKEELKRKEIPYDIPVFDNLEKALTATNPDWAFVCTPDNTHCDVCVTVLKHKVNLIVEKPFATSVWECDRIIKAAKESGREVIVAHNYRSYHWAMVVERMVREGKIGDVLSVDAAEVLGMQHGGDYFHRWHSDFSKSAGMLNHKACHHFDLINWIIKDQPICASAFGSRAYYKPRLNFDCADRCKECKQGEKCLHCYDWDEWDGIYRRIYLDCEHVDGYIRDKCVFSDRHTIYDNYHVNLQFKSGVHGTYTMLNFGPREFVFINITGTEGRIESGITSDTGDEYVRYITNDNSIKYMDFKDEGGMHGHGGADIRMLASMLGFEGEYIDSNSLATAEEARLAVLPADMANRSLARGGVPICADETGRDIPPVQPQPSCNVESGHP